MPCEAPKFHAEPRSELPPAFAFASVKAGSKAMFAPERSAPA